MKNRRVMIISAEMAPFSKSGGLGDVVGALPIHLAKQGHQVTVVTPFWGFMKHQPIPLEDAGETTITIDKADYDIRFRKTQYRDNLEIVFVQSEECFGRYQVHMYAHNNDALRFFLFNKAIVRFLTTLDPLPEVINCHDWHAGLIPNLLHAGAKREPKLADPATVFTFHNLPFQMQGNWWTVPEDMVDEGRGSPSCDPDRIRWLNFMRRGIMYADIISTVSERYAQEVLSPEFGQGLERLLKKREQDLFGIINGIDYAVFNPQFDPNLWFDYDWNRLDRKLLNKRKLQELVGLEPNDQIPLLGMVHRMTEQKGFDLIEKILPYLIELNVQIVVVGSGDKDYIKMFQDLAKQYPHNIGIFTPPMGTPENKEISSRIYAGSDMFLMPSRYEPCGVSQLISLRYGSIPIVHKTGGLSDTVVDFNPRTGRGTGFVFSHYRPENLLMAITRALENFKYPQAWEHLTWEAMKESYSWETPAQKYWELYELAIKRHRQRREESSSAE